MQRGKYEHIWYILRPMTKAISTKPLSGYLELLPAQQRRLMSMMDTIREVYEEHGFIPMDQPAIERVEVLLSRVGDETEKELLRIARDDEKALALRFDLTVPLARYVANNYGSLTFPFRRYAIGKVYRGERPQAGRLREFYQCDVDIIGHQTLSVRHDAEIVILITKLFQRLALGRFQIRINHRKLFDGLFRALRLEEKQEEIMRLIDKREKITNEAFEKGLKNCLLNEDQHALLHAFLEAENLQALTDLSLEDELFTQGLKELQTVFGLSHASAMDPSSFVYDPTIVRGLDYYTGTVFETQLVDHPEFGSVCSGGRYDNLTTAYTKHILPGVGMSLGLSRLFDQLLKQGVINPSSQQTQSQVLIIPLEEPQVAPALSLQNQLLAQSIACEVSLSETKLQKRLTYGSKLGIPYVIILGEEEISSGYYTLRRMSDGLEERIPLEDMIKRLGT